MGGGPVSALRPLTGYRFRLHPDYAVTRVAGLSVAERAALPTLVDDPDLYGVLRSTRDGARTAVGRAAGAVVEAIVASGVFAPLAGTERDATNTVALLVLDGVLELDAGEGFVRGIAAHPSLFTPREHAGEGTIARHSRAATIAASHLEGIEPDQFWQRLYFYGRIPPSPRELRRFPGRDSLPAMLRGAPYEASARSLRAHWFAIAPPASNDRWSIWRLAGVSVPAHPRYKLYISPRWEELPRAFGTVVDALAASGTPTFKVASDLHGALRPDKMVAYFPTMDRLKTAAATLATALDGLPAHGVPFTADYAGDGLLSWGIDPPAMPGAAHPSWRVWVTRRLASALITARQVDAPLIAPWRYAFDRISLDGVDPDTWVPAPDLFETTG